MYEALAFWGCVLCATLLFISIAIYIAAWIVKTVCISLEKALDEQEKKKEEEVEK